VREAVRAAALEEMRIEARTFICMYICNRVCKASWLAERALHEYDASVVDTDATGLNSAVVSAGGGGGGGGGL